MALFRLLRPKQWAKNLLVFAAIIFAGHLHQPGDLSRALAAFLAMCLVSSATYIANDVADVDRDRVHPQKKHRPIASGAVAPTTGLVLAVGLLVVGLGVGFWLGVGSLAVLGGYLALQVAYNVGLKRIPVADVYTIATGFVLRAVFGATAIDVKISGWLLFCTGALALMLGFAKRRHEFILQGEQRASSRESLVRYDQKTLDGLVLMFATAAALCYGIYVLESSTAARFPSIILTAPFVFYGITRYILLVFTAGEGGEPADILFGDRHILLAIGFFLVTALLAMSGVSLPFLER